MQTVFVFILIFGSLVFVHELGHLIFAKRAGILCREFAIGMGPKIFSFFYKETLYTIRILPIGGFVKMAGEEPDPFNLKPGQQVGFVLSEGEVVKIITNNFEQYQMADVLEVKDFDLEDKLFLSFYNGDEEIIKYPVHKRAMICENGVEYQIAPRNRQFGYKSVYQRMVAIFAGPFMNFVFAFILFAILGFSQGVAVNDARLGEITNNSPAIEAGLERGDVIKSVNGQEVSSWNELVLEIQELPNEQVVFVVERDGKTFSKEVMTSSDESGEVGKLGVYPYLEKNPFRVLSSSAKRILEVSSAIFEGLGKLITGKFSIDALSGPVGIYTSTDEIVKTGYLTVIAWTAFLSVNLGVVNLLPLPALDGGRILLLFVELIRRKPLSREKEGIVHFIGFAFLLILMLVVTWNDIQGLFN